MFRVKSGFHFKEVKLGERKILIGRDYVARDHPDAEYQYRAVCIAALDHQATENSP